MTFTQASHPFQALRRTMLLVVALVLATAGAAAAQWTGSDDFTTSTLSAFTLATDSSRQRDFSESETSRRSGTASMGIKNVYQEYFFGYWHNIRTISDMNSGSYADAAGYSPIPSTCRNGRFIGDHYSNSTKVGSTVVNPPYDNCP